uniref:Uncharacterized protein n=1 Tax=Mustela putorius furo TaxID=9669 RepID=M3YI50_MUSPF
MLGVFPVDPSSTLSLPLSEPSPGPALSTITTTMARPRLPDPFRAPQPLDPVFRPEPHPPRGLSVKACSLPRALS